MAKSTLDKLKELKDKSSGYRSVQTKKVASSTSSSSDTSTKLRALYDQNKATSKARVSTVKNPTFEEYQAAQENRFSKEETKAYYTKNRVTGLSPAEEAKLAKQQEDYAEKLAYSNPSNPYENGQYWNTPVSQFGAYGTTDDPLYSAHKRVVYSTGQLQDNNIAIPIPEVAEKVEKKKDKAGFLETIGNLLSGMQYGAANAANTLTDTNKKGFSGELKDATRGVLKGIESSLHPGDASEKYQQWRGTYTSMYNNLTEAKYKRGEMTQAEYDKEKKGNVWKGLGSDILLDPANFIGGIGLVGKAATLGTKGTSAVTKLDDLAKVLKVSKEVAAAMPVNEVRSTLKAAGHAEDVIRNATEYSSLLSYAKRTSKSSLNGMMDETQLIRNADYTVQKTLKAAGVKSTQGLTVLGKNVLSTKQAGFIADKVYGKIGDTSVGKGIQSLLDETKIKMFGVDSKLYNTANNTFGGKLSGAKKLIKYTTEDYKRTGDIKGVLDAVQMKDEMNIGKNIKNYKTYEDMQKSLKIKRTIQKIKGDASEEMVKAMENSDEIMNDVLRVDNYSLKNPDFGKELVKKKNSMGERETQLQGALVEKSEELQRTLQDIDKYKAGLSPNGLESKAIKRAEKLRDEIDAAQEEFDAIQSFYKVNKHITRIETGNAEKISKGVGEIFSDPKYKKTSDRIEDNVKYAQSKYAKTQNNQYNIKLKEKKAKILKASGKKNLMGEDLREYNAYKEFIGKHYADTVHAAVYNDDGVSGKFSKGLKTMFDKLPEENKVRVLKDLGMDSIDDIPRRLDKETAKEGIARLKKIADRIDADTPITENQFVALEKKFADSGENLYKAFFKYRDVRIEKAMQKVEDDYMKVSPDIAKSLLDEGDNLHEFIDNPGAIKNSITEEYEFYRDAKNAELKAIRAKKKKLPEGWEILNQKDFKTEFLKKILEESKNGKEIPSILAKDYETYKAKKLEEMLHGIDKIQTPEDIRNLPRDVWDEFIGTTYNRVLGAGDLNKISDVSSARYSSIAAKTMAENQADQIIKKYSVEIDTAKAAKNQEKMLVNGVETPVVAEKKIVTKYFHSDFDAIMDDIEKSFNTTGAETLEEAVLKQNLDLEDSAKLNNYYLEDVKLPDGTTVKRVAPDRGYWSPTEDYKMNAMDEKIGFVMRSMDEDIKTMVVKDKRFAELGKANKELNKALKTIYDKSIDPETYAGIKLNYQGKKVALMKKISEAKQLLAKPSAKEVELQNAVKRIQDELKQNSDAISELSSKMKTGGVEQVDQITRESVMKSKAYIDLEKQIERLSKDRGKIKDWEELTQAARKAQEGLMSKAEESARKIEAIKNKNSRKFSKDPGALLDEKKTIPKINNSSERGFITIEETTIDGLKSQNKRSTKLLGDVVESFSEKPIAKQIDELNAEKKLLRAKLSITKNQLKNLPEDLLKKKQRVAVESLQKEGIADGLNLQEKTYLERKLSELSPEKRKIALEDYQEERRLIQAKGEIATQAKNLQRMLSKTLKDDGVEEAKNITNLYLSGWAEHGAAQRELVRLTSKLDPSLPKAKLDEYGGLIEIEKAKILETADAHKNYQTFLDSDIATFRAVAAKVHNKEFLFGSAKAGTKMDDTFFKEIESLVEKHPIIEASYKQEAYVDQLDTPYKDTRFKEDELAGNSKNLFTAEKQLLSMDKERAMAKAAQEARGDKGKLAELRAKVEADFATKQNTLDLKYKAKDTKEIPTEDIVKPGINRERDAAYYTTKIASAIQNPKTPLEMGFAKSIVNKMAKKEDIDNIRKFLDDEDIVKELGDSAGEIKKFLDETPSIDRTSARTILERINGWHQGEDISKLALRKADISKEVNGYLKGIQSVEEIGLKYKLRDDKIFESMYSVALRHEDFVASVKNKIFMDVEIGSKNLKIHTEFDPDAMNATRRMLNVIESQHNMDLGNIFNDMDVYVINSTKGLSEDVLGAYNNGKAMILDLRESPEFTLLHEASHNAKATLDKTIGLKASNKAVNAVNKLFKQELKALPEEDMNQLINLLTGSRSLIMQNNDTAHVAKALSEGFVSKYAKMAKDAGGNLMKKGGITMGGEENFVELMSAILFDHRTSAFLRTKLPGTYNEMAVFLANLPQKGMDDIAKGLTPPHIMSESHLVNIKSKLFKENLMLVKEFETARKLTNSVEINRAIQNIEMRLQHVQEMINNPHLMAQEVLEEGTSDRLNKTTGVLQKNWDKVRDELVKKNFTEQDAKVMVNLMQVMRSDFTKMADLENVFGKIDEPIEALIDNTINAYVPHMLHPKYRGDKDIQKILTALKTIKSTTYENKFAKIRDYKGSIEKLNAAIAEKMGEKAPKEGYFDTNLARLYFERSRGHNQTMYAEGFQDKFFATFGTHYQKGVSKEMYDHYQSLFEDPDMILVRKGEMGKRGKMTVLKDDSFLGYDELTAWQAMSDHAVPNNPYVRIDKSAIDTVDAIVMDSDNMYFINRRHWDLYEKEALSQWTEDQKNFGTMVRDFYDNFTNKVFKPLATVVNPAFHMTNAIGNQFLSYIGAGVAAFNPVNQANAARIMMGSKLAKTLKIDGQKIMGQTIGEWEEILKGYGTLGTDFFRTEDMMTLAPEQFNKAAIAGNKVKSAVTAVPRGVIGFGSAVGGAIEGQAKVNLFLTEVMKGKSYQEAADTVAKYLFDYSDLTDFENKVMKRIFPFYTFMRKNVEAQTISAFEHPERIGKYARTKTEVEDQLLPEEDPMRAAYRPDYLSGASYLGDGEYINIRTPLDDLKKFVNPLDMYSSINPLIKTAVEGVTGKNVNFNEDIELYPGYKAKAPLYLWPLSEETPNGYFTDPRLRYFARNILPSMENYSLWAQQGMAKLGYAQDLTDQEKTKLDGFAAVIKKYKITDEQLAEMQRQALYDYAEELEGNVKAAKKQGYIKPTN